MLDIISSNAGSLTRENRIWSVQRFLREQSINILAVQETHLSDQNVITCKRITPDVQILANNGAQGERGVAIFCTPNIDIEEIKLADFFNTVPGLANIEPGRLLAARITLEDVELTILNVYAPNNARNRRDLFCTLAALIRQLDGPYILVGDWNNVLDPELDRASSAIQQQNPSREALQDLLNASSSVDAFRATHPLHRFFTFKRGERIASRLDRIYISRELMPIMAKAEHRAGIGIDHTHGPVVTLRPGARIQKGQETWRMNNLAMRDPELTDSLSAMITDIEQTLRPVRDAVPT